MAANFWTSSQFEQWIFSKQDLVRLRHRDLQFFSEEEYQKLNIFWANFIQALACEGVPVKPRMQVIATAIMYFKRFYTQRSFKDMSPFLTACTALVLATKVEEHGQFSMTNLIRNIPVIISKKWPDCPFDSATATREIIYEAEFIMVEIMDCCLIVFHPHRPLKLYIEDFKQSSNIPNFDQLEVQFTKIANDTLRCDASLIYPPHTIALSCMIVGTQLLNKGIRELGKWLDSLQINMQAVSDCTNLLFKMYTLWKEFDEKTTAKTLIEKMPKVEPNPPNSIGISESGKSMSSGSFK